MILTYNFSLDRYHKMSLVSSLFTVVLFISLVDRILDILMLNNCPWTLETNTSSQLLTMCQYFIEVFIDSFILLSMLLLVVGYTLVKDHVKGNELKYIVIVVVCNFVLQQVKMGFWTYWSVQMVHAGW